MTIILLTNYFVRWKEILNKKSNEELVLEDENLNIMNFNIFFGQAFKTENKGSFEKELDNLEILGKTLIRIYC